jgi:hypothetical protein
MKISHRSKLPTLTLSLLLVSALFAAGCAAVDDGEGSAEGTLAAQPIGSLEVEEASLCSLTGFVRVSTSPSHVRCPSGVACRATCTLFPVWSAARTISLQYQQNGTCATLHSSGRWAWQVKQSPSSTWTTGSFTLPAGVSLGNTYSIQVPNSGFLDWGKCEFRLDWMKFQ